MNPKISSRLSLLFVFFLFTLPSTFAQKKWQHVTTAEDICIYMPETMKTMLDQFNLDTPGMEQVKQAHKNGNLVQACKELLAYYKNGSTASYLRNCFKISI